MSNEMSEMKTRQGANAKLVSKRTERGTGGYGEKRKGAMRGRGKRKKHFRNLKKRELDLTIIPSLYRKDVQLRQGQGLQGSLRAHPSKLPSRSACSPVLEDDNPPRELWQMGGRVHGRGDHGDLGWKMRTARAPPSPVRSPLPCESIKCIKYDSFRRSKSKSAIFPNGTSRGEGENRSEERASTKSSISAFPFHFKLWIPHK